MTNWNQFKGDPRHSGRRRDFEGPNRVQEAWTVDLDGDAGSPVYDRDTVYVLTNRACHALERARGRERWTVEIDAAAESTPVVTRDTLYLTSADDTVRALETTTGDQRWAATLPGTLESSLALADGLLFVGHEAGVSALEADTGEVVWTHETDAAVVGTPAVDRVRDRAHGDEWGSDTPEPDELDLLSLEDARMDEETTQTADRDRVCVATADEQVLALEADTGEPCWDAPTNGTVVDGPTITGDRVYVADDSGTLVALHADSGQSWFTYKIQQSFASSPTVLPERDTTFVGATDGYVHVTDTTFGRRKLRGWLFAKKGVALDGTISASPAVAGEICCVGDSTGSFYGIDLTDDCNPCWHVGLDGPITAPPALGTDHLFVVGGDRLYRLEWDIDEPSV
ncbi:PQQ-like domain-containing protein [Natronorubrum sediminis]|uniref:PQQ-like domain-containing protein n=1 Tax=Natronorubrum sediminis TaxID=640943 RepID=A0A1H6FTY5_9EURY|nr:PQQ-binding-like beta-propeller repeat protein [Natronorubrum sediminis]SEH13294.1 PQQ-like domain-containing protein [Natronorubrum sediminis]